jgi:hypothetical protein
MGARLYARWIAAADIGAAVLSGDFGQAVVAALDISAKAFGRASRGRPLFGRRAVGIVGSCLVAITLLLCAAEAATPERQFARRSFCSSAAEAAAPEREFMRLNEVAMDRMIAGMDAPPSGNIDQDFVDMMEPHHQGAIEMAIAELKYGRNELLRRIAQEIIIEQRQEIDAMRLAIGRQPEAPSPAPTQAARP